MGKGKWISFAEALERVGSLEVLVHEVLREGYAFARATDWRTSDGKSTNVDRNIPSAWWAMATHVAPARGRATFTLVRGDRGRNKPPDTYDLVAIGIEVERAPIDVSWPAKPTRKKSVAKKEKTSAAGTKESPLWEAKIVPLLKTLFPGKPYPSKNETFHAAKDWLLDNNKAMSDSAIREGIKRHFPEWFPDDED